MAEIVIKSNEDFKKNEHKQLQFKGQVITGDQVKLFGNLTGDWNEHNEKATEQFPEKAVQGFLSLSLFGGFHKKVCDIPASDPMNTKGSFTIKRPLPVGQKFTATLTITEIVNHEKYTQVEWTYELWNSDEQILFEAIIVLRYSKK